MTFIMNLAFCAGAVSILTVGGCVRFHRAQLTEGRQQTLIQTWANNRRWTVSWRRVWQARGIELQGLSIVRKIAS